MLDYYFTRNISESQRFSTFNYAHFIYIALIILTLVLLTIYLRKKPVEDRWRLLRRFVWIMPVLYFFRLAMFIYLDRELGISYLEHRLPLEICDFSMFLLPIAMYTRNRIVLNYLYAIAMIGAIIANLTPSTDYYGHYASFSWQIMFFFIAHGLIVIFVLLPITTGLFRPDYRTIPKFFGLFACYCVFVYIINSIIGSNYIYINKPAKGTPTVLFDQWFGTPGFLIPFALLFLVIISLFYLPWMIGDKRNQKKRGTSL